MEEGEGEERAESSSDQEQEEDDDEEDMDYTQLEDSAPSAEDYSSQSDDDAEGNDSSTNIRYIVNLSSSTESTCKIIFVTSYGGSMAEWFRVLVLLSGGQDLFLR